MKIAMIGQRGVPATFGGVERHVEELGARLAADGHEVVVFCRRGYGESEPERYRGMRLVHQHTVDSKHLESFVASATADRGDRSGRASTSCTTTPSGPACSPRSCAAAVRRTRRANDSRARRRAGQVGPRRQRAAALRDLAERPGARRARSSCRSRSRTPTASGTAGRPCTSSTARPEVTPRPAAAITERWGLTRGSYVLSVGRLVPEKAPEHLLSAFADVPGDTRLVLAGGSSHTDEYVGDLARDGRGRTRG